MLIVKHPGDNVLSQYYPVAHRRFFLLPNSRAERQSARWEGLLTALPEIGDTHGNNPSIDLATAATTSQFLSEKAKPRVIDVRDSTPETSADV